jgi:glucans biosynthesis protein C
VTDLTQLSDRSHHRPPLRTYLDYRLLRQPVRTEARQVGDATRRSELDRLRALVVVGLVFFHSAVIFGPGEFPVKAGAEYPLAAVFLAFGATWGMPLLFVISGIGIRYSLGSRSPAEFARERLRRLGVPLLVGLLTLVPVQVYLGRRQAGETSSYADFYARFWDVRPSLDFPFVVRADPAGGLFETGHLWFLVCLLGFSLALLPGLVLLGRPPGRRLVERLAGLLARPGGLLLPMLLLAAVEVLRGSDTGHGAWNDASYALFLVYGFLASDPGIGQTFRRRWRSAMTLGGLLLVAAAVAFLAASAGGDPLTALDLQAMGFRLLKSAAGWAWVVAILGLAGSRGARPGTPPASAPVRRLGVSVNDALLAFYVLHEPVVVVVACVVLGWPVAPGVQYLLISGVSLAATGLLCEFGVRRHPVARYLFGLKPVRGTIDP